MKKLLLVLVCMVMALVLGCTPTYQMPDDADSELNNNLDDYVAGDIHTVRLPQDIIDAAVAESDGKDDWGINLGKVRINYVVGTRVEAAIVLHNGNDCERLVRIRYSPTYKDKYDMEEMNQLLIEEGMSNSEIQSLALEEMIQIVGGSEELVYSPSPIEASGWVAIDTQSIRLDEMQTAVVPIYLLVPDDVDHLPYRWEFDIKADGFSISQYQYTVIVTTVENDTVLEQHLPRPLMGDSVESVLDIISEEDEIPYATSYDAENGVLTIEGLKESAVREMTIIFEYEEPIAIGYSQRWLVTMLD